MAQSDIDTIAQEHLPEDPKPNYSRKDRKTSAMADNCRPTHCFSCFGFEGNRTASGSAWLGSGRGAIVTANIFISSALIYLASEAAGCLTDDGIIEECDTKIYGFRPSSLVTNIAMIIGLVSAVTMPFIGAVIDYTPYRRATGIISALLLGCIQGVQIYTVSKTWFPMAILQAIAGFLYQVQVLSVYAYLPDIAKDVGQKSMTNISSNLNLLQFLGQSTFLIIVTGISFVFQTNTVVTSHISQGLNCFLLAISFTIGWRSIPNARQRNVAPQGSNLLLLGFQTNLLTVRDIYRNNKNLMWFLLATAFAEAGANAFSVVSITFMSEVLKMNGNEVGVVFLAVLVSSLPGTKLAQFVTKRTNPNTSWKLCMAMFTVSITSAAFILTNEERKLQLYIFSLFWGINFGWFYPTEGLYFSMTIPKGKETELTGFYVYCTLILSWLPPLVFTVMNESGIHMKWGLASMVLFFIAAIGFLSMTDPWDQIVEEASKTTRAGTIELEDLEENQSSE